MTDHLAKPSESLGQRLVREAFDAFTAWNDRFSDKLEEFDMADRTEIYGYWCEGMHIGHAVERFGAQRTHDLYKPGDKDAPDCIRDQNGYVVLGMCRRCGRAEIELSEPCAAIGSTEGASADKE